MDPLAKGLERALGGFPWLVQTLTGVSHEALERWYAEHCSTERWQAAHAMFMHFAPTIGDQLISMFLHGFILPAGPMLLPEQERSVLFLWSPSLGRYPNGILSQVLLAVKRRGLVVDPSGVHDFEKWKTTIDCRDATIVDFLIVPEIQ